MEVYILNLHMKRVLEKTLNSVVSLKNVYSNNVQSRRIEGQFGGEMLKKAFSEINVYIQYTPTLLNYDLLKDILNQCYFVCKSINTGVPLGIRCYLFNDKDYGILPINKDIFFRQNHEQEPLLKAFGDFHTSGDIRTLNRLTRGSSLSENALCVFITDDLGCEISGIAKMKYKYIDKQSIWTTVNKEIIDIRKGIPILSQSSMEGNDE